MAWIYFILAVLFEIGWASSLKFTEGYSHLWPSIGNALIAVCGVLTLSQAVKIIPISIAYPMWVGISMVGVMLVGFWLGESIGLKHILFASLILIGAVGLKTL